MKRLSNISPVYFLKIKADIEWLKFACCLRETGMTIVEMKEFARLTLQGDETINERMDRLHNQKARVKSQVDQLVSYMSMIEHKLEFYSKYRMVPMQKLSSITAPV